MQLRQNLEIALERIQDAEDGAIALLDENAEIFQQARQTVSHIALLQQQFNKAKRGAVIGFAFGGVSFGVGVPLMTHGIISDNSTMLWTGAGITAGTGLIWVLGHFVLNWW